MCVYRGDMRGGECVLACVCVCVCATVCVCVCIRVGVYRREGEFVCVCAGVLCV